MTLTRGLHYEVDVPFRRVVEEIAYIFRDTQLCREGVKTIASRPDALDESAIWF